jgi:hypothetical protein
LRGLHVPHQGHQFVVAAQIGHRLPPNPDI